MIFLRSYNRKDFAMTHVRNVRFNEYSPGSVWYSGTYVYLGHIVIVRAVMYSRKEEKNMKYLHNKPVKHIKTKGLLSNRRQQTPRYITRTLLFYYWMIARGVLTPSRRCTMTCTSNYYYSFPNTYYIHTPMRIIDFLLFQRMG